MGWKLMPRYEYGEFVSVIAEMPVEEEEEE